MRRWIALAAATLLLSGCAARQEETEGREEALRARYAALEGCAARVEAGFTRGEETYTLDVLRAGEKTRVTVLAPEELAGIAAAVNEDEGLSLEYEGMVLAAGSTAEGISPVTAVSLLLRAAADGCVTERSTEDFEDEGPALRLRFETEQAGKPLYVTAWFDGADAPLYAEFEQDGEILAYLRFTDFAFGDILSLTADGTDETAGESEAHHDGNTAQTNLG